MFSRRKLILTISVLPLLLFGCTLKSKRPDLPDNLRADELLYESSLSSPKSVKGWKMEGPGEVKFKDGWMEMFSPDEEMHHVFWCPERFPDSFVAQWEAQNLKTDAGLCIVFFAAAAKDGGSIFADNLPKRGGHFQRYTKGAIRCYHTSYYANAAHNPDREQTNLRKNPGFHLVQEGREGIPTKSEKVHTITLAKEGGHIRLWVDDKKVLDWTDEGKKGEDPHGDGFIGFRQMKWTHFRYRDLKVWSVSSEDTKEQSWRGAPPDIPKMSNVKIDGETGDWDDRGFVIPQLHRQVASTWWKDAEDAAEVRLGWDDEGLVALIRTTDDQWVEADNEKQLWKLDGIELYAAKSLGSSQYYQLVVSPGMSDEHPALRYKLHDHRQSKDGSLKVDIARRKYGKTCVLEVRLAWKNLAITPRLAREYGFQVMVNDHDGFGKKYENTDHTAWYRGVGTAFDSGKMQRVRLAGSSGESVEADGHLEQTADGKTVLSIRAAPDLTGQEVTVGRQNSTIGTGKLSLMDGAKFAGTRIELPSPSGGEQPDWIRAKTNGELFLWRDLNTLNAIKLKRLTSPDEFCTFGAYATSPESPDGTRVVYTKFVDKPTDDRWRYPAEVWICDREGNNHRKIAECGKSNAHNGVEAAWVNNRLICANNVKHKGKTGVAILEAANGEVVHGPFPGAEVGHEAHDGQLLMMVRKEKGELDRGVWRLDAQTGNTEKLCTISDFVPYRDRMDTTDDPKNWHFGHAEWNTDGSLWSVVIFTDNWTKGFHFFLTPEGEIESYFGPKIGHPSFYGPRTLYGAHKGKTMLVRLNTETVKPFCGYSCHPHLSPNKQWLVTDYIWGQKPVKVLLYQKGQMDGSVIDQHPYGDIIWDVGAHTNPSWNYDGSRIYYLKGNDRGNAECWYAVPNIKQSSRQKVDNRKNSGGKD